MNDTDDGCNDTSDVSAPAEALPPPPDWGAWLYDFKVGHPLTATDIGHISMLVSDAKLGREHWERWRAVVDAKGKRPDHGVAGDPWVTFADAETVRANNAEEELKLSDEMAEDFRKIVLCLRTELCAELADLATIIEHTDGPTAAKLVRELAGRRLLPMNLPRRPGSANPEKS